MKLFDKGSISYISGARDLFCAPETFDFNRFADRCGNFTFIERLIDYKMLEEIREERIVQLELEDPNRFFTNNPSFHHIDYEHCFSKIFTICPYTAHWLNQHYGNNKRTVVFFPFNENYVPQVTEKKYDIIYSGNVLSKELEESVRSISKFNYRLVSSKHHLSTDTDANYEKKLMLTAESKISLVHNILFLDERHIRNVHRNAPNYRGNEAFRLVPNDSLFGRLKGKIRPRTAIVPQIKSRLMDAAFCKSLILCRKDPFNVIEKFFDPITEFVYYEPGELEKKIEEILANYASYQPIIDRAYERAMKEYTTKAFYEKYLQVL